MMLVRRGLVALTYKYGVVRLCPLSSDSYAPRISARVPQATAGLQTRQAASAPAASDVPKAPLQETEMLNGRVAANFHTWLESLITCHPRYPCPATSEHQLDPPEPPSAVRRYKDSTEFRTELASAATRAMHSYEPPEQTAWEEALTRLSLDGGLGPALPATTATIRSKWVLDGCLTAKELLSKLQGTAQALTSLSNRGWQVTESPVPGAFALGDYLHLQGPAVKETPLSSLPYKGLVASAICGDWLSGLALRLRDGSMPLTALQLDPKAHAGLLRMQFVGPLCRHVSNRVTSYGSLRWGADGTPVLVPMNPFDSLKEARPSGRVARAGQTRMLGLGMPATRKGKSRGHALFQGTAATAGVLGAADFVHNAHLLQQPLVHDPFLQLTSGRSTSAPAKAGAGHRTRAQTLAPAAEGAEEAGGQVAIDSNSTSRAGAKHQPPMLTWTRYNASLSWRGLASDLLSYLCHLPIALSHPACTLLLHSPADVHGHRPYLKAFFAPWTSPVAQGGAAAQGGKDVMYLLLPFYSTRKAPRDEEQWEADCTIRAPWQMSTFCSEGRHRGSHEARYKSYSKNTNVWTSTPYVRHVDHEALRRAQVGGSTAADRAQMHALAEAMLSSWHSAPKREADLVRYQQMRLPAAMRLLTPLVQVQPHGRSIESWIGQLPLVPAAAAPPEPKLWLDGLLRPQDEPYRTAESASTMVSPVSNFAHADYADASALRGGNDEDTMFSWRLNKRVTSFSLPGVMRGPEQDRLFRVYNTTKAGQVAPARPPVEIAAPAQRMDLSSGATHDRRFRLSGCDQLVQLDLTEPVTNLDASDRLDFVLPATPAAAHASNQHAASALGKAGHPDAALRDPPHWGIFPAVRPPDWDASTTGVNDVWRMELDVKALWNGAASLEDAAAKTSALHKSLSAMLQEEKWAVESVCEGVVMLACDSNAVDGRGYLSKHVDFGVWPEVRRVKCASDQCREALRVDETLPYTLVDEQVRRAHGLLPAEQLDDMLGMRSAAHVAAAKVLRRFTAEAAAESDGAVHVTEAEGILQVHRKQAPASATEVPPRL